MAAAVASFGLAVDTWQVVEALSSLFHHDRGSKISTNVRIGIGSTTSNQNQGGSVPHIALWDDHGHRIGQYKGNRNGHLDMGSVTDFNIEHSQTVPQFTNAQAEYVMLSMMERDAICISYISVTWPGGVNYMFFGDVGYKCGADWYYSDLIVSADRYTPKCIWLDQDHTNGLHHQGMGIHISDFLATPARLEEYQNIPDAMCKSTPRFQMYPNILPDQWHSFYLPPLKFFKNGTDTNYNRIINAKGQNLGYQPPFKRSLGDSKAPRVIKRKTNPQPSHLIVSKFGDHSAVELCGSEQSYGHDFVSVAESIFCDMSTKTAWPLCDASTVRDCFNLNTKQMVGHGSHPRRSEGWSGTVPIKSYDTVAEWGPK